MALKVLTVAPIPICEYHNETGESIMETTDNNTTTRSIANNAKQKNNLYMSDDAIMAGVIDLMVGVSMRGWLTDHEMNFLDNLGMERGATFLIRDGQYLHPNEVELFPMEIIKASIRQGGDAIFSHRLTEPKTKTTHVHTAIVSDSSTHTDILGFIGPDELLPTKKTEDWFCHLVELFRDASKQTNSAIATLKDHLTDSTAMIVINRSSGRVLYINNHAEDLLGIEAKEVTGSEYGRIRHLLRRSLTSHKITIDNLEFGELYLSTVTLSPVMIKTTNTTTNNATLRGALREQISVLQTATDQIEQLGATLQNQAIISTAHLVRNEVVQLSKHLLEPERPRDTKQHKRVASTPHITDKVEIL